MKKMLMALAASLMLVSVAAFAVPTAQQIEQAMSQGNWQRADAGLSEVLQAHPNNAHAHYLYAQVLDREGKYSDALDHLQQSKSLDPSLKFTDATRFAQTEARIRTDASNASASANGSARASQTGAMAANPFNPAAAAAPAEKHGPSMGAWVGIAVLFVGIALVLRWGLRRARAKDDGQADDDRRAQLKRATELLNEVRSLKLDVRLSTVPGHEAMLSEVEGIETQLRELLDALSNAKNPVPPYRVEDLERQVASVKARSEGRPDPAAVAQQPVGNGQSPYAQEAERFGRGQPAPGPYPPQPGQQPPVIIQQGGGGFGGGMGGLLTGVLLGEALSGGRERVIEREVPVDDELRRRGGNDQGGGLDFGNGSNDWNDGGGGTDMGNNDSGGWSDT